MQDEVTNNGAAPTTLYPYALVSRHGTWDFDYHQILGISAQDTGSHYMNYIHFNPTALGRRLPTPTSGRPMPMVRPQPPISPMARQQRSVRPSTAVTHPRLRR